MFSLENPHKHWYIIFSSYTASAQLLWLKLYFHDEYVNHSSKSIALPSKLSLLSWQWIDTDEGRKLITFIAAFPTIEWIPSEATGGQNTHVQLFLSPSRKCLPLTLFLRQTVPEGCQKEIEGQRTAENLSPSRTVVTLDSGRRTPLYDFRAGDCFSMSQGRLH